MKSHSTEGVKVTHEERINGGESHKTFVPRIIKVAEIGEKLDKIRENLSEENGKNVTLYHVETKSAKQRVNVIDIKQILYLLKMFILL